jgi:MFS family permease
MIIIFAVLINLLGSSSDGLLNVSLIHRNILWFNNLPNTLAIVSISSSIGILLGSLFTKDFFKDVSSLLIISLILLNTALLPITIILLPSKILLVTLLFTLGYLLGKINPRISAYIISEVPEEKLGLTSGIFSILVMAGTPIGQLIFLGSANVFSDTLSWILFGTLSVIFLLISSFYGKKVVDPITVKQ